MFFCGYIWSTKISFFFFEQISSQKIRRNECGNIKYYFFFIKQTNKHIRIHIYENIHK